MATPTKLGKYEVVRLIGQGGFGVVYEARDPFIRRRVAIKTCTASDDELRRRFYREAEIAGNLQHKNIVTVHDFGLEDDVPYLVQEYLTGEDLDAKIRRGDAIAPLTKLDYLIQIAEGLEVAHEAGVIHRDIKPGNIRVLENGRVKIMDFGIARLAAAESKFTRAKVAMGTQGYISPEQLQGEGVDQRADVFSYGVLAYELITYRKPFQADSFQALFYQILNKPPVPVREGWPECPPTLAALVEKCLHKRREERFAGFGEILAELQLAQSELPGFASGSRPTLVPAGQTAPAAERLPREPAVETEATPATPIPTALGAVQERIRAAVDRGDVNGAELELTLARKKFGGEEAFGALAESLRGAIREAREKKAELERRPEHVAALVQRAREHLEQGALDDAQLALQAALELAPADPAAGALQAQVGEAMTRAKRHANLLLEAAKALEAGDLEAASRKAKEAVGLGPQDGATLELERRIGRARSEQEAAQRQERARKLVGEARETLEQGDAQKAQWALNEAVSLWPEVPEGTGLRKLIEAALAWGNQPATGRGATPSSSPSASPPSSKGAPRSPAVGELKIESLFARRYRIKGKLGQGGMGTVYRAVDQTLEVPVALKVINPKLARDRQMLERLKREVVLARKIAHPSVCRIHDIGEGDGLHYVSMELVEGSDLSDVIRQAGRLDAEKAVRITREVLDGLREAHRAGVIHRDLKPQNIMLGTDGRPHIMDFGISVSADVQRLTQSGVVVGTPDYMAPEQALGSAMDHRVDIYAIGVILFRMLTGRLPFEGKTPVDVMLAHFKSAPPRPSVLVPGLPEGLDHVIERALAKKPEDRYASAEEMQSALAVLAAKGLQSPAELDFGHSPTLSHIVSPGATATLGRQAILAWVEEARVRLDGGDLTGATQLVERALRHDAALPDARRVRDEIERARQGRETLGQLPQAVGEPVAAREQPRAAETKAKTAGETEQRRRKGAEPTALLPSAPEPTVVVVPDVGRGGATELAPARPARAPRGTTSAGTKAAAPRGAPLVPLALVGLVVIGIAVYSLTRPGDSVPPPSSTVPPVSTTPAPPPSTTLAAAPSTTVPPATPPPTTPTPDPRLGEARAQAAAQLRQVQSLYRRGAREEALQAAEKGLRLYPREPDLTRAVQGFLGDAGAAVAQAHEAALRGGDRASASAMFLEAKRREQDAQRQASAGHAEEAIRSLWAAEEAYRRVAAESARLSTPPPTLPPPPTTLALPPPPTTLAPPVESVAAARQAIRGVLDEFRSAFESRNVDALKAVQPGVDYEKMKGIFGNVTAYGLKVDVKSISVDGLNGTADCVVTYSPVPKPAGKTSPVPTRFFLKKTGDVWLIERLVAR